MKILHIIRGMANSSGTTHIVGPLAEAQARLGHDVTVFFVEKPREGAIVPDPSLVQSRCFPMTISSVHFGWSRPFQIHLRQCVSGFDVVHIHAIWNFPTWCAMREARRAGVPYIVAPQGSLEDWALGRSRRLKQLYAMLFEKPAFDRAARMQCLTETEATQCARFGIRAPASILPNGVDLALIDSSGVPADLRTELDLPPDEKLLLFLGRIFPKKGLDVLAKAFGRLLRDRSDVSLLIAGHDGDSGYTHDVAQMLLACGARSKAHFLGEVSGKRKFQVLRAADLFVLPSYSEGLPVAVVEAMGAARPVVITPGCNLPEVHDSEAGWIVEPDATTLYEALRKVLAAPDECHRRGLNGRALVEGRFTWSNIAEQSISIYHTITSQDNAIDLISV